MVTEAVADENIGDEFQGRGLHDPSLSDKKDSFIALSLCF